ncbi:hypothetical protein Bca101_074497 [Brassica carinata]
MEKKEIAEHEAVKKEPESFLLERLGNVPMHALCLGDSSFGEEEIGEKKEYITIWSSF